MLHRLPSERLCDSSAGTYETFYTNTSSHVSATNVREWLLPLAQEIFRTYQTYALHFCFKCDVRILMVFGNLPSNTYPILTTIKIPSCNLCGRHVWSFPSILVIFPQEGAERALPQSTHHIPTHLATKERVSPPTVPSFTLSLPHSRSLTDPIDSAHSASLIWKNHQPNHRSLILLPCRI